MASRLRQLDSLTGSEIDSYLASYNDALTRKASASTSDLVALDEWYQSLPKLDELSRLNETIHTKDDVVRLMRWKLSREKHRPTLLSLVQSNPASFCQDLLRRAATFLVQHQHASTSTKSALEAQSRIVQETMKILMELKGVGPATSSAIVAAWTDIGVFQSDELVMAVMGEAVKIAYTPGFYKKFYASASEVLEKWKAMNEQTAAMDGRSMERLAWSIFYNRDAAEDQPGTRSGVSAAAQSEEAAEMTTPNSRTAESEQEASTKGKRKTKDGDAGTRSGVNAAAQSEEAAERTASNSRTTESEQEASTKGKRKTKDADAKLDKAEDTLLTRRTSKRLRAQK